METEDIHIILNLTTIVFTAFIIIAAILAWRYIGKQEKNKELAKKRHWIEQLPSLISTLGVLGTFFGITIGLIFFDTKNLDSSIPLLLSGLQTAFFTSLAGMISSLIISRRVNSYYDKEDSGKNDIQKVADSIVNAIKTIANTQKEYNNKVFTRIEAIDRLSKTLVDIKKSTVTGLDKLEDINQSLSNISDGIDQIKDDVEEIKGHGQCISNISDGIDQIKDDVEEIKGHGQCISNISDGIDQIKDDVEEIKGLGNTFESQQNRLQKIDESIKKVKAEITRLLAVTVTMTASVSKLDNALTDKK